MGSLYSIIMLILALSLAACGGGGGSAGTVSPAPSGGDESTGSGKAGEDEGGEEASPEPGPEGDFKAAFDGALESSVLQYEITDGSAKKTHFSNELLAYPETAYFHFSDPYMVFELERKGKAKARSELRQYPEWKIADENRMAATVKLEASSLNEYTWMQLHRKEPYSVKPPLRLTWAKAQTLDGKVYQDYLVAVFYHEDSGYHKVPLIPRPDGEMTAELRAYNHQVFIRLNGSLVHVENVAGWSSYHCYFKLGLYTSGSQPAHGQARVGVKQVEFSHDPAL